MVIRKSTGVYQHTVEQGIAPNRLVCSIRDGEMMSGSYPTRGELKRVRKWPHTDPDGWFVYIRSIGEYWPSSWGWIEEEGDDNGKPVKELHISTGGWSGNEEILDAMQRNYILWSLTWHNHQRGGHYIFRPRDADPAPEPTGILTGERKGE